MTAPSIPHFTFGGHPSKIKRPSLRLVVSETGSVFYRKGGNRIAFFDAWELGKDILMTDIDGLCVLTGMGFLQRRWKLDCIF